VRALYHWVAPFYDAFRVAWSRLTRPIEGELDRLIRERIGPEARILELAPGTGINVVRLLREAPRFASYLGIDASEDMLERGAASSARRRTEVDVSVLPLDGPPFPPGAGHSGLSPWK
jgi:ubiquinone/menaquinone biosynthesis C-methylase UbiE